MHLLISEYTDGREYLKREFQRIEFRSNAILSALYSENCDRAIVPGTLTGLKPEHALKRRNSMSVI